MKLRVGLIGLGDQWKTVHRPALRIMDERFDVRAVYCGVSKLAENAVAEFQADPVDGYQAMVSRDDIDAVLILEDSWLKHLPAMAACRAGKAIYWASGLDFDPIRDAEFKQCVESSGIAFMAGLPRRFAPATLRLKELIATDLGKPLMLFCHNRLNVQDGGAPRKQQMHAELIQLIDWCSYVVDQSPESVMSSTCDADDASDYQALSVRFAGESRTRSMKLPRSVQQQWGAGKPNGRSTAVSADNSGEQPAYVTAQISCGSYIPACWQEAIGFRPPAAMQVRCENGVAFIDLPGTLVWFDDAGRHHESLDGESPVGEKMLAQFHRAVTSLVRNLSGLEDAFQAASVLQAAGISNEEGRRVSMKSFEPGF